MKFCGLVFAILCASSVVAAPAPPSFPPLEATTPQLTAAYRWHQALVAGDFERYQSAAVEIFGWSPAEGTRKRFDELRTNVPPKLWIVISLPMSNQMQEIHLIGCSGANVMLAAVTVAPMAGESTWKAVSSQAFVKPAVPSTFVCPVPGEATAAAPADSPAPPISDTNLLYPKVPLPGQAGDRIPATVYVVSGLPQSINWGYIKSVDGDRLTIESGSATQSYQLTSATRLCLSGTASTKPGELGRRIGNPVSVIVNSLATDKTVIRVDDTHLPLEKEGFMPAGPKFPDCK
jgi:hypothetical protein